MTKKLHLIKTKYLLIWILISLNIQGFGQNTKPSYNGLALTPPMGWNTWNTFFCDISEEKIKGAADSLISSGMKDAGYEYIVVDDCWQIARDSKGVIVVDSIKFPNGIKSLVDYVHSKGLKFGIYSDAGTMTCQSKPGSYNHEEIDAKTYADWGVDYVKFDWCFTTGEDAQTQYTKMSKALTSTSRPIVFSICEWGLSSPWLWAHSVGNLWRTTNDIQPCWNCTQTWGGMGWTVIINKVANLSRYSGPGHWNDEDMLEVGNSGLSDIESQAHFSMWCILASPLMAGNDIRIMSKYTKSLLTNKELIAVDQDSLGIQGTRIMKDYGSEIWCKPLNDSSKAIAFFNRSAYSTKMTLKWNQIGFLDGNATVRDLWLHSDLGQIKDSIQVTIPSHGSVVYKVKGTIDQTKSLNLRTHSLTIKQGNSTFVYFDRKPFNSETDITISNQNVISAKEFDVNQYRITGNTIGNSKFIITSIDGKLSDTCNVTVIPSDIPSPWSFNLISETVGSGFFQNDTFTILSRGVDIGTNSDQCGFVNQNTTLNKTLSCRVLSQTPTSPLAKSGIMFRGTTSIASPFALLTVTPSNLLLFEYRLKENKIATTITLDTIETPIYLRLRKTKTSFIAYTSVDGTIWKKVDSINIPNFPASYLFGLETVSNNIHAINEAKFDKVEIITDSTLTNYEEIFNTNSNSNIKIFPNPAKNDIIVSIENDTFKDNCILQICTIDGRILTEKVLKSNDLQNQIKIDISNITNGVYILLVKNNDKIEKSKFIVNKKE